MSDRDARCAHLTLYYDPTDMGDGTVREHWSCDSCNAAFLSVARHDSEVYRIAKLAVAWKRELEQTIDRLRDECAQRKKSQRDAAEWLERKSRELHEQAPAFPNLATALGMLGLSLGQDPLSKETREKMEACRAACPEEADSTKTATTEEKQHGA